MSSSNNNVNNNKSISDSTGAFDSGKLLRRIERERRLKEIEQTFQNIAEEAKQTQEDIYSNVFTERGQTETLASHNRSESRSTPPSVSVENNDGNMFSRVSDFVSNRPKTSPPSFQMSPTGVSSFPEIGPIGVAHKKKTPSWHNDGPGFGARLTNARVQDNIFQSFFSMRSNSRKLIFAVLFFCFMVTLLVTLIDISKGPDVELGNEGWTKLRIIRPQLVAQNVDKERLHDYESHYFAALVWLSDEATQVTIADQRELLERYVMLVFYFTTKGESWSNNSNWLEKGSSICKWHGVTCNDSTDSNNKVGTVKTIKLHSNQLEGPLTDELSKLNSLQELVLSKNNLVGKVPSSLGSLSSLESLELGENELTGYMPESICDLKETNLAILTSDCGGQDRDIECLCCTECSP